MSDLQLDPATTALVLIDLQRGIVSRETAPRSAMDVVQTGSRLATAFRKHGATVVYVHVDLANFLDLATDAPRSAANGPPPASASELVPEAGYEKGDLLVTKRHWGAFGTTDLAEQLRQRGVTTIVVGGIATNYGVESTVREGTGLGFAVVVVEDATATASAELHAFAYAHVFPRLGRVRTADEVIGALG